jgi:hypothetical protein
MNRFGREAASPQPLRGASVRPGARESRTVSGTTPAEQVLVRLMFSPGSSTLESTHAFLTAYTADRLPAAAAQRVSLAAYELLSNAMNYASLSSDVVLEIVQNADRTIVRTANDAIGARIAMLREQVDKIRSDSEGAFVQELKRSMKGGHTRAMLGLARIAFEVGLKLDLDITGQRVRVSAELHRDERR